MFLKSLDIHGFKSFADKTKIEFDEGVTGIVGPNGCGKSNIVDSIRWVLGETSAKALRGGEMADVIFNGTDKRQPLGMAEVTLTLSGCSGVLDTDYDEVQLGRRVYRDGRGEYLVNKQPCRLKDIHNLLMDTGIGRSSYSIMEQGKIDQLLSSKPEDRRAVFEEAAGITKFKSQKKEALRKLDYTEANLVRLRDIVEEVERQMRSLQRQAGKARRYQVLHTDVKVLDLHYSHKLWREQRAEKAELETSIAALREQQDGLEIHVEEEQGAITEARQALQEIDARVSQLQSQLREKENAIQNATNRIEFNTERAHELSVLIKQNEGDIDSTSGKLNQQQADLQEADHMLQSVDEKIAQYEGRVREYEEGSQKARQERADIGRKLDELRRERNGLESKVASLEARIENHQRQLESDQQRFVQLNDELSRLQKDEQARNRDAESIRKRIEDLRGTIDGLEDDLSAKEDQYHDARRVLDGLQNDLSEFHRVFTEKSSRLEVLRQLVAEGEGFEKGTQAVLKGLDQPDLFQKAVRGALASFIDVDREFVVAIEAALGRHLQTIVVADTLVAENMIEALRRGKLGKATLVSEESVRPATDRQLLTVPDGAIGWALDQIDCGEKVRSLVDQLLDNVLIVPDLTTALNLHREMRDVAFATLGGEFVSAEGVIHGGVSGEEGGSFLQRQSDIRELEVATETLAKALDRLEDRRDNLVERVEKLEDQLGSYRDRLQQRRVSCSTQEGQLAVVERDLQQLENKLESLRWEQKEVAQRQDELDEQLSAAQQEKAETLSRIDAIGEETGKLGNQLESAERNEAEAAELLNEVKTSLAVERQARGSLVSQREPMAGRLRELEELLTRRNTEIESYRQRIANSEQESISLQETIETAKADSTGLSEELNRVRSERQQHADTIQASESQMSEERRSIQQIAKQRGQEEVKAAQIGIRLEQIETSARERYQVELERFEPDSHALLAVIDSQRQAHERNEKRRATLASKQDGEGEDEDDDATRSEGVSSAFDDESAANAAASDDESDADNVVAFPDPAEPDWDFVEEIVAQLRSRLDSMGPVNIDAIEEFEELEQHYQFNVQQMKDLENSKEELMRMIARINRDTRKMFGETFEKIRVNFQDMFKELFGPQAKSDLLLMDDGDPLESGIDVIAKPPGKKLQSISLLSGGERSMTAVALLFAIYMVKPSPFCVLDELDAPLDDSNIGRFIRVLDRFIGDSQFIIVTHSKRTMSRADVMYGVSMEEFGVSKTVGVKFTKDDTREETVVGRKDEVEVGA
ncbi:MAG: chromosome segregation protein SMC [Verrucomicrobiae bacterium]|nr:chromosome segregation protein SMC [Verrucomicrobiae bacterium]